MSKKLKNVCATLNYIEHFPILVFEITECVSFFAFPFFLGILLRIKSSAIGLNICAITTRIKKYKSIIKKNKKKHDKT